MSELRSSLARHVPRAPTSPDEMQALRRAAWRKQGVAVLPLDDVRDDWTRQAIVNEANRLYGKRHEVDRG